MSAATRATHPFSPSGDARCGWLLRPANGGLVCAAHPVGTSPWFHPQGCDLPVASLCRVCSRAAVPIRSRFSWSFACPACRNIDSVLAAPYRAASMLPLEGQADANRGTLYQRLHPEEADRTRRTLLLTFQSGLLATMSASSGLEVVEVDHASAGPVLSRSGRPMTPVGPGPYVRWAQWQEEFPASIDASVRAYQRAVRTVHPWIDSVEPRVADLGWLSTLVAASS